MILADACQTCPINACRTCPITDCVKTCPISDAFKLPFMRRNNYHTRRYKRQYINSSCSSTLLTSAIQQQHSSSTPYLFTSKSWKTSGTNARTLSLICRFPKLYIILQIATSTNSPPTANLFWAPPVAERNKYISNPPKLAATWEKYRLVSVHINGRQFNSSFFPATKTIRRLRKGRQERWNWICRPPNLPLQ